MVPCFPLLGLTPSGLFMGSSSTIIYTSELILCSTIYDPWRPLRQKVGHDLKELTHGLLEKQVFSFHFYYFSFYLRFRLVRKLVFLYFNVNVYLMEIPCLNKVTYLPTVPG